MMSLSKQRQRQRINLPSITSIIVFLVRLSSLTYTASASSYGNNNVFFFQRLLPQRTILTWVNGIGHNADHMNDGQASLSRLFGNRPIRYCHNPTAMTKGDDYLGYIGDLTQAGTQKMGRITTEVDALVKHLKEAINEVGPKGKIIHIAHSQGSLITFLASSKLTKGEMEQIEIISFGGAASLHRSIERPFIRCVNYYSVNDPLLFVVPNAARALRSGVWGGGLWSSNNSGVTGSNLVVDETRANDEPEFVFLTPRGGDPILDHSLLGPTYIDALKWEGRRYQALYLPIWYPFIQVLVIWMNIIGDIIFNIFKTLLKRTILAWIVFVMNVNRSLKNQLILPIIWFTKMVVWESCVKEIIQFWKNGVTGDENQFEEVVFKKQEEENS